MSAKSQSKIVSDLIQSLCSNIFSKLLLVNPFHSQVEQRKAKKYRIQSYKHIDSTKDRAVRKRAGLIRHSDAEKAENLTGQTKCLWNICPMLLIWQSIVRSCWILRLQAKCLVQCLEFSANCRGVLQKHDYVVLTAMTFFVLWLTLVRYGKGRTS